MQTNEEKSCLIKPIPYYLGVRYVPFWKLMWTSKMKEQPQVVEESPSEPEAALTKETTEQELKPDIEQKLDAILASSRSVSRKPIRKNHEDRAIHLRKRKTSEQLKILEKGMKEESLTKEQIKKIAIEAGLKLSQAYKWYWDHKKKIV